VKTLPRLLRASFERMAMALLIISGAGLDPQVASAQAAQTGTIAGTVVARESGRAGCVEGRVIPELDPMSPLRGRPQ